MVAGFLYKRFIMGAKGWDQFPGLKYYQEFGNLEAVSSTIDHLQWLLHILYCFKEVLECVMILTWKLFHYYCWNDCENKD